jgi:hypothetical protein
MHVGHDHRDRRFIHRFSHFGFIDEWYLDLQEARVGHQLG